MAAGYCYCLGIKSNNFFLKDNKKAFILWLNVPKVTAYFTQSKLVRCVKGRVLDVAVDIRKGSPTYGKHVAVELTEDNHRQFFIPKGFAHGFAVLSNISVITSITLRLMGVSLSWMNHSGLIGAFLRNMLIFPKRIQNMRC